MITEDGQDVAGEVHVGVGETSWSFIPAEAWTQNELIVFASIELEDVAGNNFRDLLDHLAKTGSTDVSSKSLYVKLKNCSEEIQPMMLKSTTHSRW